MHFDFLVETYATERLKVLSTWSTFQDGDLGSRPNPRDPRGRSVLEQMVHQCVGENGWFINMLGIDVGAPPLPAEETRLDFIERYAADSAARETALGRQQDDAWWNEIVGFFEVKRSRAWVLTRRIAHTAHHRGQQTALLRVLDRDVFSTYGPTADTGGLPANNASAVYPYRDATHLLTSEAAGGAKNALPGNPTLPSTERP